MPSRTRRTGRAAADRHSLPAAAVVLAETGALVGPDLGAEPGEMGIEARRVGGQQFCLSPPADVTKLAGVRRELLAAAAFNREPDADVGMSSIDSHGLGNGDEDRMSVHVGTDDSEFLPRLTVRRLSWVLIRFDVSARWQPRPALMWSTSSTLPSVGSVGTT